MALGGNVEKSATVCSQISSSSLDRGSKLRATRGLLAKDHVILNHGQVTWTTPKLAPPLLTPTPHQWEDVSALDRYNVHRCPTRRVFNGIGLELVARQATIRYLYHSATAAVTPAGIEPATSGLRSGTLPLSHRPDPTRERHL
ncbi:uncharacterized protein TNCV_498621 [Trichonephila clavipes]|nr:uncharacterized protein TNCV_498621 [Trichonephila clavipes]